MVDLGALRAANAKRWAEAKLTRPGFTSVAKALVASIARQRYLAVQNKTGVPWWFIAVVHERESGQRWDRSLAQGDPWNTVSVHVPKGRGPFSSWDEAAIDALVNCNPHSAANTDWSPGGAMTALELYNGLGYAMRSLPSPYVWAGTNQYAKGKFVSDGVFNADVVDQQLGCAGLLLAMIALDPSLKIGVSVPHLPPKPPVPVPVAQPSLIERIVAFFAAIFRRK